MEGPNFILIGAAGYVAPRHMEAIKSVGGNLVAAIDPHDSVGILDRYFPECRFFTEFERLDRHIHKMLARNERIDYVSICSPNYLHDAHCRWAMRIGADAICEKPLVLNERNLDGLALDEEKTGQRVWNMLQLRVHPALTEPFPPPEDKHNTVQVQYITPRGAWYSTSWKADVSKSGGLATNIGVHLFDLVTHLFGKMKGLSVFWSTSDLVRGWLELENANINWGLSIESHLSPKRMFNINGKSYDFTTGFADLHNAVYHNVIVGNGFGLEDARESIRICEAIRGC